MVAVDQSTDIVRQISDGIEEITATINMATADAERLSTPKKKRVNSERGDADEQYRNDGQQVGRGS